MKLIKQAILFFRQGRSDKVYEVDLCQVSADRYVVDFRYGRRGSDLAEGSKTVVPVPLAEAERTYRQLLESKLKKGYQYRDQFEADDDDAAAAAAATEPDERLGSASAASPPARPLGPRERIVLERLRVAPTGKSGRDNPLLLRAIWRAGELELGPAEPALVELARGVAGKPEGVSFLLRYCTVWALGRLGARPAIAALEAMGQKDQASETLHEMIAESLRRLYRVHDPAAYQALLEGYIGRLPEPLASLARSGPAEAFRRELRAHVDGGAPSAMRALAWCYLIDNVHVRPGLLSVLSDLPLERGLFARVRRLFKAAEFRRDGEVFGLLGYRFEKTRARRLSWHQRRDKTQPFRETTRHYLRRRVWRTLRRLGRDDSPDFVAMAVGVLLPFTDDDGGQARSRRYYRWRASDIELRWDRFAGFWAFNQLLYGQSPRYVADGRGRTFRCRASYKPGDPAPEGREESFPELWQRTPAALLHLIDESDCERVHEFACKVLRACPSFLDTLDAEVAAMLLGRPYDLTAKLGFELARRLYSRTFDDAERVELIAAVAECRLEDARRQARAWFDVVRSRLTDHSRLWAVLATSAYPDNREYARLALRTAFLSEAAERALIGRMMAVIAKLGERDETRIADIGATLLACFASRLAALGADIIGDLLRHPAAAAHELAGRILLEHRDLAENLPDRVLYALLGSDSEAVRAIGAELMAKLSDRALAGHEELLLLLSTHEHADLRVGIRPVIQRLAANQPDFAARMVARFIEQLMHKQDKGVHSHLLSLLAEDLRAHLAQVPKERVLTLLYHKHPHAQELGGILLAQNIGPDELSVAELVKLASHEILAVRQGAWAMCEKAIERLRRAMPTAIRLLDAKWQDSRAFAFAFFRERFTRAELSPDILVAICDGVRPDVQKFGREMITRYFDPADGHTYLMRLSEHPSERLQLFASTYVEDYACGQPERIRALEPFFLSVLSRVNKGRVAKQRAIAFLHREALIDASTAAIAGRIFARQSATIAVGEREAMIKAMVDIARAHPGVSLPIHIKPPEQPSGPPPGPPGTAPGAHTGPSSEGV